MFVKPQKTCQKSTKATHWQPNEKSLRTPRHQHRPKTLKPLIAALIAPLIAPLTAIVFAPIYGCNKSGDKQKTHVSIKTTAESNEAMQLDTNTTGQKSAKKAPTDREDSRARLVSSSGQILKLVELARGHGDPAKAGDSVIVHYTGTLTDGRKFDSSLDRGKPFRFTLGVGKVIEGWDKGVLGMKVGGKRRLRIPPAMAYMERGIPGVIPPQTTLIFEVELLSINGQPNRTP